MQKKWFLRLHENGKVQGPYTSEQILLLCQKQKILPGYLLSSDQSRWSPAAKVLRKLMSEEKNSQEVSFEIAHYQVMREIGRGTRGVVYHAYDTKQKRHCALKTLKPDTKNSKKSIEDFLEKTKEASCLEHSNIVSIYEIGNEPCYFISMEYIDGRTLQECLGDHKLPLENCLKVFIKICQAVHYAHQKKIVHRDLKPENIIVNQDLNPKIMDFGVACHFDEETLSQTDKVFEIPKYMAPEIADGKKASPQSDIYSLGSILYKILTHRAPFEGESAMEVLYQLASREPIAPSQLNPAIKKELELVCLYSLKKSPVKRCPSALFLAEEIENILENVPIKTRPPGVVERISLWGQRYPVAIALFILSFLITILSTGFYYSKSQAKDRLEKINFKLRQQKESIELAKREKEEAFILSQQKLGAAHWQMAQYHISLCNFSKALPRIKLAQKIFSQNKEWESAQNLAKIQLQLQYSILPSLPLLTDEWEIPYKVDSFYACSEDYIATFRNGEVYIWSQNALKKEKLRSLSLEQSFLRLPARKSKFLFLPDQKTLFYHSKGGIALSDVEKEEDLHILTPPFAGSPTGLALNFSHNGRILVVRIEKELFLFSAKTLKKLLSFSLAENSSMLSLSHLLAAVNGKNGNIIYNTDFGIEIQDQRKSPQKISHISQQIMALALSPKEKEVVYGDGNGRVFIYDFSKKSEFLLFSHSGKIRSLNFSPNGRLLVSVDQQGDVIVWDMLSRKTILKIPLGEDVHLAKFTKRHSLVTISTKLKKTKVRKWYIEPSLKETLSFQKEDQELYEKFKKSVPNVDFLYQTPMQISQQKSYLSSSYYFYFSLWNLQEQGYTILHHNNYFPIRSHSISPLEDKLAISYGREVWVYNLPSPKTSPPLVLDEKTTMAPLCFSQDGKILIVVQGDKGQEFSFYDLEAQKNVLRKSSSITIEALAVDPGNRWLSLGLQNGDIEIHPKETWLETQREKEYFLGQGNNSRVSSLAWHPFNEVLAVGTKEGELVLWQKNPGSENYWFEKKVTHLGLEIKNIKFSPNGDKVCLFTQKNSFIYSFSLKTLVPVLLGYYKNGISALSSDWELLAFPSQSGNILIFRWPNVKFANFSGKELKAKLEELILEKSKVTYGKKD